MITVEHLAAEELTICIGVGGSSFIILFYNSIGNNLTSGLEEPSWSIAKS